MAVGWAYIGGNPGSWKNVFCKTATSPAGDIAGKKCFFYEASMGEIWPGDEAGIGK
jgi:hypothetical protein